MSANSEGAVRASIPAFHSPLCFQDDGGLPFTLLGSLIYGPTCVGGMSVMVEVPAGFKTDLASIPRPLWAVLPPVGRYDAAAVLHDYLYQTAFVWSHGGPTTTRADADAVFNDAMGVLGVPRWQRWTIYLGVRAGGWAVWRRYRSAEAHAAMNTKET